MTKKIPISHSFAKNISTRTQQSSVNVYNLIVGSDPDLLQNSNWECNSVVCSEADCDLRDILFNKRECCPVCARRALGSQGCSS